MVLAMIVLAPPIPNAVLLLHDTNSVAWSRLSGVEFWTSSVDLGGKDIV